VADSSTPGNGQGGCGVVFAAFLLVMGYALVNQEKLPKLARHLPGFLQSPSVSEPGGRLHKDLSETSSMSFGKDSKECTLEMYWAGSLLHYRARTKVTQDQFDKVLGVTGHHFPVMRFSLRNRFGEERIRVDIAADTFRRDDSSGDGVTACGSVPASEADYRECVDSKESRAFNHFAD
jgi:hypothetical protein